MKIAIKICGVRDPDLAKQAIEFGAQYVGIICYPVSSRYVEPNLGRQIATAVKKAEGIPVAVFVDQNAEQMLSLCELMGVDTVQLAGPTARQQHHQLPKNYRRIYVLPVDDSGFVQPDCDQGLSTLVLTRDCILYDGLQSGSGRTFSLNQSMNVYPLPFFLAGGLTPENVVEAINAVHPAAVDVSSGVESKPGVKAIERMKAFIAAVRGMSS